VTVKDGEMTLLQGELVHEKILTTCKKDFDTWIDGRAFIQLELQLRVLGYDFPLVMDFGDGRIIAHLYL
jgi:hypothetical protein